MTKKKKISCEWKSKFAREGYEMWRGSMAPSAAPKRRLCGHQRSPETSLHPNLSNKFGEIPVMGQGGGCGSTLEAPLLGAISLEEM